MNDIAFLLLAAFCAGLLYVSVLFMCVWLLVQSIRSRDYDCAFGGFVGVLYMLGGGALVAFALAAL